MILLLVLNIVSSDSSSDERLKFYFCNVKDIRKISSEELTDSMLAFGEKAFRARQIEEWLWKKSGTSFDEMTNLSLEVRDHLKSNFAINAITVEKTQISADQTIKSAFKLHDDHLIEGVLIPADDRMTACVSSQVGCSLTCKFCATGYMDRKRNLDAAEIYDQVVAIRNQAEEHYNKPLTNIVFMGMGEPLLNYANVLQSIEHITSPKELGMSPRRITVSTAGIAKMIKQLADDEVKFRLALSLHAANDIKRNQIMPINETNSLKNLKEALQYFYKKTKSRLTFEYIVFNNFNDSLEDAEELFRFTKQVPSKVNIIEYNPISEADFTNTDEDRLQKFSTFLEDRGVNVHVRHSRGKDIDAACGQLANK
ncbi:MAG: 23S rRNA (adenine(2503)-C(2))-methyltransferase RlmN [Bacteroidetes bacterium]|nr:23S rRNA (adenine(2503)-C(2))-methyltransferase RlmN [Bacteroidota bacterium]MDA1119559.1 23S rRNA (adenine(2503)-C(2))-methyltransferase RlmN [Bacteroidota bacterium]